MSRALVIRGADFAENAVAQVSINLPYDAEVSYLQGDGTAYIDSGIHATSDTQFEVELNLSNVSSQNIGILGGRTDAYVGNVVVYLDGVSNTKAWNWRYGAEIHAVTYRGEGDYLVSNKAEARTLVVTGAKTDSYSNSAATFTGGSTIAIFGWNKNNGTIDAVAGTTSLKLKSCKIYQGGNLVRNFIPVRVGTEGFLYDKVSREFFGNAAESGAFVVGPDK